MTTTNKTLDTLVDDVYNLFDPKQKHQVSEENLDEFCNSLKEILRHRLKGEDDDEIRTPLRFSTLGKPDRQVWYDAHPEKDKEEELTGKTRFKFLYGDVIEHLLLFLIKESGHRVERTQEEIDVDGIKGHIDAIIDGTVVDIKSASPYGFKKFKQNTLVGDDPFGYVAQLAGYADVITPGEQAAWIAMDKVSGDLCVTYLSTSVIADHRPAPRIDQLKKVVESEFPPERCYDPVPDGKSGNLKLPTTCSYCRHKFRCHPGLRTFLYSTGPRFLTKVSKTPDVPEVIIGTPEEPELTD